MIMIQLACAGSDWGHTNPLTSAYRQKFLLETITPFEKLNSQRGNVHPVWVLKFKNENGGVSNACAKGIPRLRERSISSVVFTIVAHTVCYLQRTNVARPQTLRSVALFHVEDRRT